MHEARAGKTQRLAGEALETRAQCEMLAFDLLHRQLPHRVLRGRKMPLIDLRLVCVIPGDTKRREQGARLCQSPFFYQGLRERVRASFCHQLGTAGTGKTMHDPKLQPRGDNSPRRSAGDARSRGHFCWPVLRRPHSMASSAAAQ